MRIVICSDAPLESEANASIRGSIHDGWVQQLGEEHVVSAGLRAAPRVIAERSPDIVLAVGSYLPETAYFTETIRAARTVGATSVFWATEDPYEKDASYRIEPLFDAVFTCDLWGRNFYDHPRAFHLPLAGCARRHRKEIDPDVERPIDVLFCGVAFANRLEVMETLRPSLDGCRICVIGPGWGGLGAGFSDQRVDKSELISLYSRSKLVLNLGRSLNFENSRHMITPSTPGPRTFEAAMAGTVQLFHEDTSELDRYFTPDEIPRFSGSTEFRRLRDRLLDDDAERNAIACRAQARALAEHSYASRANTMVETLRAEGML